MHEEEKKVQGNSLVDALKELHHGEDPILLLFAGGCVEELLQSFVD
jgi:hypothetical protein